MNKFEQNVLTVSIVTYKHEIEDIKSALESVFKSILVDNLYIIDNSPSNTISKELFEERIVYVYNPSNPGYGAAHNIAIKRTIEKSVKYHLVLNPDVNFEPNTLKTLITFMDANPDIGNIMPQVFYPDKSIQYLCKLLPTPYDWIGRRFNPLRKLVEKRNSSFELRFTNYDKTMEIPYLSGCFMFLRVSALKEIGLFDENIFMYGEETDLCRRLIAGGYKTVFYPDVEIIHEFQKGSHKSFRLTWIGIKSAIYYFNKWGWFFDKERRKINKEALKKLGYKK